MYYNTCILYSVLLFSLVTRALALLEDVAMMLVSVLTEEEILQPENEGD